MVIDPDVLRREMTGPPDETAHRARGQALATTAALLGDGHDVVVPQLVARVSELERFEDVARTVRARFLHVLLVDAGDDPVARFHRRDGADAWHDEVRAVVEAEGGDAVLDRYLVGLAEVHAARPDLHVIRSVEGDLDQSWAALRETLA